MKIVILSLRNIFDSYLARPHVWPRTTRTQQPYHPIRPDGGKRILTPDKQTPPPFHHPPQQGLPLRRKRKKGKLSPITSDYIGTSTLPTIMDPQQIRHSITHPPPTTTGIAPSKRKKKGKLLSMTHDYKAQMHHWLPNHARNLTNHNIIIKE